MTPGYNQLYLIKHDRCECFDNVVTCMEQCSPYVIFLATQSAPGRFKVLHLCTLCYLIAGSACYPFIISVAATGKPERNFVTFIAIFNDITS